MWNVVNLFMIRSVTDGQAGRTSHLMDTLITPDAVVKLKKGHGPNWTGPKSGRGSLIRIS